MGDREESAGISLKGIRIAGPGRRGRRSEWRPGEQVLLERKVAVKILRPDLARDPATRDMFIEAGRQAALIVHPAAVGVINISGEYNAIVSEWLDAPTLADLREKLPLPDALGIVVSLLDCLAGLHATGRAHANLHPGNIFVSPSAAVRVGDFFQPAVMDDPAFLPGLEFYSPAVRAGEDADWRADVYSLGKIATRIANAGDAAAKTAELLERMTSAGGFPSPAMALEEVRRVKAAEERLRGMATTRNFARRQRQYQRIPAEISVAVKKRSATPAETGQILSRIRDIGENGVFVATATPMPIGSIVELDFALRKDGGRIHAFGLVRWISEPPLSPGMGVQFVEVDEAGLHTLRNFVNKKNV